MIRIEIRADRHSTRRWHRLLVDRLRHNIPEAEVRLRAVDGEGAYPGPVAALLALERMVLRKCRTSLADPLPPDADCPEAATRGDFEPDIVLDCSGAPDTTTRGDTSVLLPLFDGFPQQRALIGALLSGRMPEVTIEDGRTGATLAIAKPSTEGARGLTGGMEAALSRLLLLLEQVLRSPGGGIATGRRGPAASGPAQVARFVARAWTHDCARAIYHLCFMAPHWRIGWRFNDGPGVLERGDLGGPRWRVVPDPGTRCFADPFPVTWRGQTCMFFEDLDHRLGKGVISAMAFGEDGPRGEATPVIKENWHLSYPFVIEHGGALWMVPESSASGEVPLYRCVDFPLRWERAGTLLDNIEASDCTIFRHDGRFWMTSVTREGMGGFSDTLTIHHAANLHGPWERHGGGPALIDVGAARPAGAVVRRDGQLWRPLQDCTRGYGRVLKLARIDVLDRERFVQTVTTRLAPGRLWPGGRLHTLNRAGRIECIDGTTYNPRLRAARPLFVGPMEPRGTTDERGTDRTATDGPIRATG